MEILPWVWIASQSQKINNWDDIKVVWYFSNDKPKMNIPQHVKKIRIKDLDTSKKWIPVARNIFDKCEGQVIYWSNSYSYDKLKLFVKKWLKKDTEMDDVMIVDFINIFLI